ncbi:hypothetical protein OG729_27630 [Streptomyces sp. NBC_00210]|uniref:hypothetical protein n=1 Tax=unclassified Streptomyces TaxID=2593676 RepID=UPI00324D53D1
MTHTVEDPGTFFPLTKETAENLPAGLTVHQVLPAADGSPAHCRWEAPSVDDVRNLIDPATVGISVNEYFEVNPDEAIGLP